MNVKINQNAEYIVKKAEKAVQNPLPTKSRKYYDKFVKWMTENTVFLPKFLMVKISNGNKKSYY